MLTTDFDRELGQLLDLINQLFTAPAANGGVGLRAVVTAGNLKSV